MGADHSRWLLCRTGAPCENQRFEDSPNSPLDGNLEPFEEAEEDSTDVRKEESSDLSVQFEYVCKSFGGGSPTGDLGGKHYGAAAEDLSRDDPPTLWLPQEAHSNSLLGSKFKKARNSSFSSLSGAALSANATLANTKVCNNMIGGVVLPVLDSPRHFRRLMTFPSSLSSSSSDGSSTHSRLSASLSPSKSGYLNVEDSNAKNLLSNSAPDSSSFLYGQEIQTAGGAAGEDRLQAVCSEENGLLFCGIYDGFNGRDAADYLAAHLYEKIGLQLRFLDLQLTPSMSNAEGCAYSAPPSSTESDSYLLQHPMSVSPDCSGNACCWTQGAAQGTGNVWQRLSNDDIAFQRLVAKGLMKALHETEIDFFDIVEQEMDDRPEIAMVGSCVLATLIHGQDLFSVNLGDSRAILASESRDSNSLCATSLSEIHNLENPSEKSRVHCEHPDDPSAVVGVRVKGKLRVTRAFGAGFLKSALYNDGLLGILRVRNLQSPPYISSTPYVHAHRIRPEDRFVVAASDGLFDFFSNQEVVNLVWDFMSRNPSGDSASYMLDLLLQRAAVNACMSVEDLKDVPSGRRRQYHDDVTIVIITLGDSPKTNSATLS